MSIHNWVKLKPHPVRQALWTTKRRFPIVVAGRGSGKTELARRYIIRNLPIIKPWADPHYFYGLPTYGQAKRVAWRVILDLVPPEWVAEKWESELRILTVFGSDLTVVGLDQPARVEGTQWDGCVIDEMCDQRPGVFDLSVRPALSYRKGFCWRIGAAKRQGIGAMYFKEKSLQHLNAEVDPDQITYTWSSEDIVDPVELESAKRNLSADDYEEQFRASWVSNKGAVFHAFSDDNITLNASYISSRQIIVGQDFNVDPMSWCLCHAAANGLIVFDEIRLSNTNTYAALDHLHQRYGQHKAGFVFIGDASARARKTSATKTDYIIIKNDERFINKTVSFSASNPPVEDRNAAVNALLCNAAGERRLFINPTCRSLIRDMQALTYKPGTREIALGAGLGHMSDALGYIVHKLFPLRYNLASPSSLVSSSG